MTDKYSLVVPQDDAQPSKLCPFEETSSSEEELCLDEKRGEDAHSTEDYEQRRFIHTRSGYGLLYGYHYPKPLGKFEKPEQRRLTTRTRRDKDVKKAGEVLAQAVKRGKTDDAKARDLEHKTVGEKGVSPVVERNRNWSGSQRSKTLTTSSKLPTLTDYLRFGSNCDSTPSQGIENIAAQADLSGGATSPDLNRS